MKYCYEKITVGHYLAKDPESHEVICSVSRVGPWWIASRGKDQVYGPTRDKAVDRWLKE